MDTNHISLMERFNAEATILQKRIARVHVSEIRVCVISYEEQIRGWMAYIAQQKSADALVAAYARLDAQRENYCNLNVLPFDASAARIYADLKKLPFKVSAPDTKIAAIALANGLTLLTQNVRDFNRFPNLKVEDWTRTPDG